CRALISALVPTRRSSDLGERPHRAALEPNRLVRVDDRALPGQPREQPALLPIEAMAQPKRDHVVQEPGMIAGVKLANPRRGEFRSEEHTPELQSRENLVC